MFITHEKRRELMGFHIPETLRRELIGLWHCLRRFPSQRVRVGKRKRRRENPRYIFEIQHIKDISEFKAWAESRNWKPGYVPVLENPRIVRNTALEHRTDVSWMDRGMTFERTLQPIHRPAGTVDSDFWVTDFDVRFISIRALHRRKKIPDNLPNLSRERLSRYRRNSKRQTSGICAFGENKSARQWSLDKRCVVTATTVTRRIKKGMDAEIALTMPAMS